MNAVELRKKSAEELRALLQERRLRHEELIVGLHEKKVKNVKEIRGVRKDIARIQTLLHPHTENDIALYPTPKI